MTRRLAVPGRYGVAAATAVSGYIHADLYVSGYRYIHWIGPLFLVQAAGSFAVAVLLPLTSSPIIRLGAAALAGGALAGFTLSRTVGILGFTEHGWQPSPQAPLAVAAEVFILVVLGYLSWRPPGSRGSDDSRFVGTSARVAGSNRKVS
jgi:hypothetical protein